MVHPLLERELGELTLRLSLCNGKWHGELIEEGSVIWTSRGETSREAVEKAATNFADYAKTEVIEI